MSNTREDDCNDVNIKMSKTEDEHPIEVSTCLQQLNSFNIQVRYILYKLLDIPYMMLLEMNHVMSPIFPSNNYNCK
jgi:hypothetical protein